jgi:hypothetical protein
MKRLRLSRRGRFALAFFLFFSYLDYLACRSFQLYECVKNENVGWKGGIFCADAELGYRNRPGAKGVQLCPYTPNIPIRIDANGCRISPDGQDDNCDGRPIMLALGDSFTFGAKCEFEDSYPEIAAHHSGYRCMNAAVCGHGIAQVLLQARMLVPRLHPDVVVVQYSPWLVEKSRTLFHQDKFGILAAPFVETIGARRLHLHPPLFTAWVYNLPIDDFRGTSRGACNW